MDDYYLKYARPLDKLNLYELKQNLNKWRDNIREELESLIFIKNILNKIDVKTKNKFFDVLQKLENVSLKEIECITEFSFEIEKKGISDIDEKVYTKVEYIRDNYNKILLNIQKMISSSNFLLEIRKNFEGNKNSLAGYNINNYKQYSNNNSNQNSNTNYIAEKGENLNHSISKKSYDEGGKEWMEKLEKDLDSLKKEQNLISTKIDNKKLSDSSLREKESKTKEYTVTKELDTLLAKNYQTLNPKSVKEDSSIRIKKISQKFPKSQNKARHYTPPHKNGGAFNTINSNIPKTNTNTINAQANNNSNRNQVTSSKNPYNYEILKNLIDEMEHLKEVCKDLKKTQEENCLLHNEKTIFEKMKNEHIKLNADMNIIKDDIKEILGNYHNLIKRVVALEEENKNLRAHNKNLIKHVQSLNNGWIENPENDTCDNYGNKNNHRMQNNYKIESNEMNNIGAYNCGKSEKNTKNSCSEKEKYPRYNNHNSNDNRYYSNTPQKSNINNYMALRPNQEDINKNIGGGYNHMNSYTMISDISAFNNNQNQSSLEMNENINNNLERTALRRRYLIPKN